ncbi:unnamed protein product [Adineta steineri]|uniref:G-protein coupled receptors family 3 profile domain-containing protein n=1 Tax=Adineta steineri TaxID=433720 RepID=A0A813QF43_9BILA|nr:unnamed protein product [Adineta steineri]
MQWLAARILSKRTKQLTALLIYLLLICIQIPIGILWWYFTFPRSCQQQQLINEYPKFQFQFQKQISLSSSIKPCSHQCIVDYRFYATYTYTIVELFLCTIIAICLFLCRYCHRNKAEKEQLLRIHKNNASLSFFNMFAFILIDIVWLLWTFIYHYTHPSFAFPSLIIGMFTIGTICLLFILIPQIYFYSKIKLNDVNITQTTLFTNKLTTIGDSKDKDSLLREKPEDNNDINNKQQIASNESELSYELGTSGTFLPITRTPRGPFKCIKRINFGSVSYRCSYCSQSCHVNCKENAGSNCKTLSNNAMLPPHSPKISTITTLKNTHRQRLTNSEPRKAGISSIHTSTIQRRLPFDGMMSHKSSSKYIPSV